MTPEEIEKGLRKLFGFVNEEGLSKMSQEEEMRIIQNDARQLAELMWLQWQAFVTTGFTAAQAFQMTNTLLSQVGKQRNSQS